METAQQPLLGAASTMAAHGKIHSNSVEPCPRVVEVLDLPPVSVGTDQSLLGEFLGQVAITHQKAEKTHEAVVLPLAESYEFGRGGHAVSSPC
jgi:hypothetical protein